MASNSGSGPSAVDNSADKAVNSSLSSNHRDQTVAPKGKGRPSPEEIEAKRRQRAEKKEREVREKQEREAAGIVGATSDGKLPFTPRTWSKVRSLDGTNAAQGDNSVRFVSWNILAQGLIRRKLFPGSDCLKWKEREAGLASELLSHNWDIAAYQEVDRIDAHGPNLSKAGKDYAYAKGYREKQHGLVVAWRRAQNDEASSSKGARPTFSKVGEKTIFYDRETVDADAKRSALSRVTRNIALFVALKRDGQSGPDNGVIVATTHLFWHPMHAYERVRQTGILKRKLVQWRASNLDWQSWPIVLAGDFNDQPHSATYKLMTGEALTQHCIEEVYASAVVHKSVDELKEKPVEEEAVVEEKAEADTPAENDDVDGEGDAEDGEDEEAEEGGADDQMLKNCRAASPSDGLLSFAELVQLHDLGQGAPASTPQSATPATSLVGHRIRKPLLSAYGSCYDRLEDAQDGNFFGSKERGRERHDDATWTPGTPNIHTGSNKEPMYTLYSSLFALTLDYIFLFPPNEAETRQTPQPRVTALLPTHRTDVLEPGVPRRGVCASDHIVIGAELSW